VYAKMIYATTKDIMISTPDRKSLCFKYDHREVSGKVALPVSETSLGLRVGP